MLLAQPWPCVYSSAYLCCYEYRVSIHTYSAIRTFNNIVIVVMAINYTFMFSIILLGSAPIDFMLRQISASGIVSVSWTPPPAPPSTGYRMTVNSEDFSGGIDTMSSSQDISVSFGVHTIRVQSRSIHFPGGIAAMDITVLGKGVALTCCVDRYLYCFR